MCCNTGACESPTDPQYNGADPCGSQKCCAVDLGCQGASPNWLYGRTCTVASTCLSNAVTGPDGKVYAYDPYFMPTTYTT